MPCCQEHRKCDCCGFTFRSSMGRVLSECRSCGGARGWFCSYCSPVGNCPECDANMAERLYGREGI